MRIDLQKVRVGFLMCFACFFLFSSSMATILWNGDAGIGNSVWKGREIKLIGDDDPGYGSITVIDDPTYGKTWRFYKPATDHRCEGHGAKGFQAAEGDEFYIGWRFKLTKPQSLSTLNAVFQWKAYGSPMLQNYPVVIKPINGNLILMISAIKASGGYTGRTLWQTPTVTDNWISIVLRMKFSKDSTIGFLEYWYNGVKQNFSNGQSRYYCRTFDGSYCDPKWGIYGGDHNEVINMVNAPKIATTYEEASPIAVAPAVPSDLTAISNSTSQVKLTWKDNAVNEDDYKIDRSTDATNWTTLTTLNANSTSYTDNSVTAGTKYYYRVYTSNSVGNSSYSNVASATTVALTVKEIKNSDPDLWFSTHPLTLRYYLSAGSHTKLVICDANGREVHVFVNRYEHAGAKSVSWDISHIPNGTYIARLTTKIGIKTIKILVTK